MSDDDSRRVKKVRKKKKTRKSHVHKVLDKVKKIAQIAGFSLEQPKELGTKTLVCGFNMPGNRKQIVYISHSGETPDGLDIISFASPCMEVRKGFLGGLGRKTAEDLLRRNSILPLGGFGLADFGDGEVLIVKSNQIVDTLTIEDFEAHVSLVALVADEYEKELGKDEF